MMRLIVWLGIVLLVLTACTQPVQPDSATENTLITFLISGDPTDEDAYRSLIEAFEAANPDVRVDLLNIPGQGDFGRRLTADFAAGAPPDLFLINYRRYGPYVARGAIEPLDAYLARSTQISGAEFYPQALAAFTWRDKLMCLPQNMSSPVVYYNKELFDAVSLAYPANNWTWDDFVAAAQALTLDLDGDGSTDQYGLGVEPALVRAAPFIWMNGGEVVDASSDQMRLALDSPASKAALAWFVALQTEHHVTPDAVAEAAESSLSRFLNGRLAMMVESRRVVPEFRRIDAFDWDVAPLPRGAQPASILHSDAFCMAAASPHKEAAWRFIEFANTRAGQTILARTGRTVPSRIDLAEDPSWLEPALKPANSRIFLDAIPSLRTSPALVTWSDIEAAVNAELGQAFYGQVSLDEALRTATERSAEFLR